MLAPPDGVELVPGRQVSAERSSRQSTQSEMVRGLNIREGRPTMFPGFDLEGPDAGRSHVAPPSNRAGLV